MAWDIVSFTESCASLFILRRKKNRGLYSNIGSFSVGAGYPWENPSTLESHSPPPPISHSSPKLPLVPALNKATPCLNVSIPVRPFPDWSCMHLWSAALACMSTGQPWSSLQHFEIFALFWIWIYYVGKLISRSHQHTYLNVYSNILNLHYIIILVCRCTKLSLVSWKRRKTSLDNMKSSVKNYNPKFIKNYRIFIMRQSRKEKK